jgi:hypothetical protein
LPVIAVTSVLNDDINCIGCVSRLKIRRDFRRLRKRIPGENRRQKSYKMIVGVLVINGIAHLKQDGRYGRCKKSCVFITT